MEELNLINILLAFVFSAGAAGCCSIYLDTNKYDIIFGALLGGLGWITYLIISKMGNGALAYLCGAFVVAILSEIIAVVTKNPATVYLLPGLLPLVPGGGMFQTMRAAVNGQMDFALSIGYNTLIAAGAIALGIATASSLTVFIKHIKKHFRKN